MSDSNDVTRSQEMMNKFAGIMKNSNGHLKILINDNPALSVSLGSNIN
jgi:hypothetical protein